MPLALPTDFVESGIARAAFPAAPGRPVGVKMGLGGRNQNRQRTAMEKMTKSNAMETETGRNR